jgi:hypothetical protein
MFTDDVLKELRDKARAEYEAERQSSASADTPIDLDNVPAPEGYTIGSWSNNFWENRSIQRLEALYASNAGGASPHTTSLVPQPSLEVPKDFTALQQEVDRLASVVASVQKEVTRLAGKDSSLVQDNGK